MSGDAGGEQRIFLRPITEADTDMIVRWRNNPRVRRNFVFRETFSRELHERWLREHINGAGDVLQWIICERAEGVSPAVVKAGRTEGTQGAADGSPGSAAGERSAAGKTVGCSGSDREYPANAEPPGRPVGSVYLRDIDRAAGSAEYGIFIGEDDAIGRGYGTAAVRLVVRLAKESLGLPGLRLRVFTDNLPAIRSYERAGFAVTRKLPAVRCTDGEERDMYLMEQMAAQAGTPQPPEDERR